jgi:hypothetical protein
MNGAHAELFSYALYHELDSETARKSLEPLKLDSYQSVKMTESEPYVSLSFSCSKGRVTFVLFSSQKGFQIQVDKSDLTNLPQVETVLRTDCGFNESGDDLARSSSREEIHDVLRQMAGSLSKLSPSSS